MAWNPRITRVTIHEFEWETADLGGDYNGFNMIWHPGNILKSKGQILTIDTDAGISGEYGKPFGGNDSTYAQVRSVAGYLIGKNPLERELIYNDIKRGMRKLDRMGMGPIDCVLWDIAGKLYDAPVYQLLGGYRKRLPAYASTLSADEFGGLDCPEAYADFALECQERGYRAFKIDPWGKVASIQREIDTVLEVRKRVGPRMDLMTDPACEYETFADALKVGRACDEANFFWYEDPYKDCGISQFAHRKLRQMIKTPLLIGEHVRTLEPHVDFIVAEATDFVRADPDYDCGITGAMKIAHAAEGFGLDVEIHAPGPAQRHCMASVRNSNYYELGLVGPRIKVTKPPLYLGNYSDELDSIDADGCVSVPEGPGLGVPINWDWVKRHETSVSVYE